MENKLNYLKRQQRKYNKGELVTGDYMVWPFNNTQQQPNAMSLGVQQTQPNGFASPGYNTMGTGVGLAAAQPGGLGGMPPQNPWGQQTPWGQQMPQIS